jgi:hypothetical protein
MFMRLLLSCVSNTTAVSDKDHLVLLVNTKTKETEWLSLNIPQTNDIVGSKGLCMSGDYLIVSLKTEKKVDRILVIDVVTERARLTNCIKSKDIHGIVSVFRGRVYCISTETSTMTNVVLSPSTYNVIRDVNHYSFNEPGNTSHYNSIINWNRRWFVSCFGKGWRDNDFSNGAIIELSKNDRIVYSNLDQPNSLFFNRNDEMCFCESGRNLFHFGRKIIWTGKNYPRGVIEDPYENGYWIACCGNSSISRLKFFNHEGMYLDSLDLPYGYSIYNIVEAEGYLSKLL